VIIPLTVRPRKRLIIYIICVYISTPVIIAHTYQTPPRAFVYYIFYTHTHTYIYIYVCVVCVCVCGYIGRTRNIQYVRITRYRPGTFINLRRRNPNRIRTLLYTLVMCAYTPDNILCDGARLMARTRDRSRICCHFINE